MASTLLIIIIITLIHKTIANPVPPPDLTQCQPTLMPDNTTTVPCCIPVGDNNIVDFVPPTYSTVRVRRGAHLVDRSYIAKYTKGVELMRSLGPDHPWNHMQQANVHCAYCDGAYNMPGYINATIEVHYTWFFFPFHRMYIYFYERILGKLIGDDTFALPFWNWDAQEGMTMPEMYMDSSSSLYDPLRNAAHLPPTTVDLNYDGTAGEPNAKEVTNRNLHTMYRQMVYASNPELFMGSKYVAGMQPSPGGGSIELIPHDTLHVWTGSSLKANVEDMGAFYSAARDPIFFAHHSNIDRMWTLWQTLPGKNRKVFQDEDWLNSSFIFWDENMKQVRVRVRDSLDTLKLGYMYQNMPIPWINHKPQQLPKLGKAVRVAEQVKIIKFPDALKLGYIYQNVLIPWINYKPLWLQKLAKAVKVEEHVTIVKFPVRLESKVSIEVKRPKVSRSKEEKENEEEVLVVDDIQFMRSEGVSFDVYMNAGDDVEAISPEFLNFAGSFVHLSMGMGKKNLRVNTRLSLGLTEMLNEMNADGDDSIVISLMPKKGGEKVTVGDVRIELSSC